jgi:hypothetical protein
MNNPKVLIVHHSAVAGTSDQFDAINNYHKSKGFPKSRLGYYTGYHFTIDKEGRTRQTKYNDEVGAHTIGWNTDSIGVCLFGDFNSEQPTTKQKEALNRLKDKLGLPMDLHRNKQSNRTCPGTNVTLEILKIEPDPIDKEKAEMIHQYMKKYPSLIVWFLRLLGRASQKS